VGARALVVMALQLRLLDNDHLGYVLGSQASLARKHCGVRIPNTPPSLYSSMERANGYEPLDRGSNPRRDTRGGVLTTVARNLRITPDHAAVVLTDSMTAFQADGRGSNPRSRSIGA